MLSKDDIAHLATLARLDVAPEEIAKLETQLGAILGYVSEISNVEVPSSVRELSAHRNVVRGDTITNEAGSYTDAILANAPKTQDGFVVVKKIL